jgi:CRP/FNR family transcriptional regulator, cyclic AMP receptor protein
MNIWHGVGYLASALVMAAFGMRAMVPLRVLAVCSNFAFLAYGLGLGLAPVYVLHAILLPMNMWRLWQAL